jgi:hypothetical protein
MKPGDAGGMDPSTFFFLRRRQSAKQRKAEAAMARRPNGMPTPSPIFWVFDRPSSTITRSSGVELDDGSVDDSVGSIEDDISVVCEVVEISVTLAFEEVWEERLVYEVVKEVDALGVSVLSTGIVTAMLVERLVCEASLVHCD